MKHVLDVQNPVMVRALNALHIALGISYSV
jgi:hypothetical protein